ncbi:MAG: aminotransferase class III-fold pyridoxal phosphate-dependent enzyme, partial [Armatimonadota bacterium]|nr:aminotransferase class III-fold pyridoxal phosphate-dependent enzyme [Armatimonadota bacterium]
PRVAAKCLEKGLILNSIGESILRFLPPLIVKKQHVDTAVDILSKALQEV